MDLDLENVLNGTSISQHKKKNLETHAFRSLIQIFNVLRIKKSVKTMEKVNRIS